MRNDYIFIKSLYIGDEINELILASASSKERKIEMIDIGNSFRKILNESWDFELPNNTSYIYCLAKAGYILIFVSRFNQILSAIIYFKFNKWLQHIPMSQKMDKHQCIFY